MSARPGNTGSEAEGRFRAGDVREGEPVELSNGHKIECMTAGVRHGRAQLRGASVIASDPAVDFQAGVDVGVTWNEGKNLRAPDVSAGLTGADKPGWATEVPPLAVEYADTGQDRAELDKKIGEFLARGTRYIWVVRLTGKRRVEVYEPGEKMYQVFAGDSLSAPGVLKNSIPVNALYDRDAARDATLNNLLQAEGYQDLDAVRAESEQLGLKRGEQLGLKRGTLQLGRTGIRDLCEVLDIELSDAREQALAVMDVDELDALRAAIKRERRWPQSL